MHPLYLIIAHGFLLGIHKQFSYISFSTWPPTPNSFLETLFFIIIKKKNHFSLSRHVLRSFSYLLIFSDHILPSFSSIDFGVSSIDVSSNPTTISSSPPNFTSYSSRVIKPHSYLKDYHFYSIQIVLTSLLIPCLMFSVITS